MFCNEKTSIQDNSAPTLKTSGGHVDTGNRRMISHIGCEDGCGYVWQFLSGTFAMQIQSSSTLWTSFTTALNVVCGGGSWEDTTKSGSFYRNGSNSRSFSDEKYGARGCSRPRRF